MCGRFFVDAKDREIDRLVASLSPGLPKAKMGEVFPSNAALVISARRHGPDVMLWGFPRSDGKGLIINARAESCRQKPYFSQALKKEPVLIPASGFYEWQDSPEGKKKFLFSNESGLLYLAGIARPFTNATGDREDRFAILTTAANPSVMPYHSRMPVLLRQEEADAWLRGENTANVLERQPWSMLARAV